MTAKAVLAWHLALRRAESRVAAAERERDLTATIAAAAISKLTDEQLEEIKGELAGGDADNTGSPGGV